MECLGKKRKGVEVCEECRKDFQGNIQLAIIWSHLSLEGYSRRRKKCKELVVSNVCDSGRRVINEVVTAPPCGVATLELPGRGLKRKIGCIDVATQMGRKKKIDQEYELVETIGKGKFGVVWLCRRKATGKEFACKTLQKGEEIVHREVEIMQHLSGHPGVVTLKAVYEDTESFHLVMELCSGGRLVDQMRREGMYSEWRAANIIKELMLAIRYCHEMGVVHRDVKPENILLTSSGQMKLADFGLAVRILHGQTLTGIVGSPAYVAPEVLEGNYSEKVDIWSAGVLLHALLAGFLPFQGDSLEAVFEAIKKEKLDFNDDKWGSISQPARNLLSGMLTRSVPERFTANQVLKHPWISFYTEPTLMARTVGPKLSTAEPLDRFPGRKRSTSDDSPTDEPSSTMAAAAAAGNTSEREEGSFVDVLAAAISRVRISEPKRSRICSPSRAIQQECSCNLQSSNLCTAF